MYKCVRIVTLLVICVASAAVGFAQAVRQPDGSWQLTNSESPRASMRDTMSSRVPVPKGARAVSFSAGEVEPSEQTGRIYEGVVGDLRVRFVGADGSYFHGVQPDTTLPFAFYNSHYPNPSSKQSPPFALLAEASFVVQVLTPEHVELGKFKLNGVSAGSYWVEPAESGQYVFQIWYNGEAVHRPIRFAYVR